MTDDPPAALLTNAQRAYLRGDKEYRPSVESDVRRRIRDRVRTLADDLLLLAGPDETVAFNAASTYDSREFEDATRDMVAAVYLMAERGGIDGADAVEDGEARGVRYEAEQTAERIRADPDSATRSDLRDILMAGVMTHDDLEELLGEPAPPIGVIGEDDVLPMFHGEAPGADKETDDE